MNSITSCDFPTNPGPDRTGLGGDQRWKRRFARSKQLESGLSQMNRERFCAGRILSADYRLRASWRAVRAAQGKLRKTTSNNNEKFDLY
jgi:hypothetical protein